MSHTVASMKDIVERVLSACRADNITPYELYSRSGRCIDDFAAQHELTSQELFVAYLVIAGVEGGIAEVH